MPSLVTHPGGPGSGPAVPATVRSHIAKAAATLVPELLGATMGDELLARIPELAESADADFREAIILSCTANVAAIQEGLQTGSSAEDATPPPDATSWAHELAHRGVPLASLLRAYRLGHWLFEQTFEETVAAIDLEAGVRQAVLAAASRYCFTYIDLVCTQLVGEYEAEREQWMRGAAAAQADLVRAIVAGDPADPREATATLRYTVHGTHVGFIVWRDGRSREAGVSLAALAKELAAELGGVQTLVVPVGEDAAWAWTTGGAGTAIPARAACLEGHATAAIGTPQTGAPGMARTHHEARAARRVADLLDAPPGTVVDYAQVALVSLVTADAGAAASFVDAQLGALGTDTDAAGRLRDTVRVFLDEQRSRSRTAERLGVHQNTVGYRVKRAEELLRHPLEERRLELEVALRLHAGLPRLRAQGAAGAVPSARGARHG